MDDTSIIFIWLLHKLGTATGALITVFAILAVIAALYAVLWGAFSSAPLCKDAIRTGWKLCKRCCYTLIACVLIHNITPSKDEVKIWVVYKVSMAVVDSDIAKTIADKTLERIFGPDLKKEIYNE